MGTNIPRVLRQLVWAGEQEQRTIGTSHVGRNDWTIRTFLRRFTRLALEFNKKVENLEAAVNRHMAYYALLLATGQNADHPSDGGGSHREIVVV